MAKTIFGLHPYFGKIQVILGCWNTVLDVFCNYMVDFEDPTLAIFCYVFPSYNSEKPLIQL